MLSVPGWLVPLRHKDFRYFIISRVISMVGDGMWMVAIPWITMQAGGESSDLALIFVAGSLGMFAAVLVGGVLADRYSRKAVVNWSYGASLVVLMGLALAYHGGARHIWQLAVTEGLLGACAAARAPALNTLTPDVVPREDLRQANVLDMTMRTLATDMAGAALGGVAVSLLSPVAVIIADALSFGLAACCLLKVHPRPNMPDAGPNARNPVGDQMVSYRAAVGYLFGHAWLWITILWSALSLFLRVGPVMVLLPYVIRDDLGGRAADYGLFMSVLGVSELVAPLVLSRWPPPRNVRRWVLILRTLGTVPLAFIPFVPTLWMVFLLGALYGGCGAVASIYWFTFLQTAIPERLRGRVMSFDSFGALALTPLSMTLAGFGSGQGFAAWIFVLAGTLPGMAALCILRWTDLTKDPSRRPVVQLD